MIVFEDEASLSNTATIFYGWSKRRNQPKICQPQRKKERRTRSISFSVKLPKLNPPSVCAKQ